MWYVIWTTTGREEYTRDLIQKFVLPDLYNRLVIPYRRKKHFQNGKSFIVENIVFPSYLFVETNCIKDFVTALNTLPGFSVVLHTDDFYSPVYDHEVNLLMKLMNDHDVIDMSTGYMEGEKIRIVSGPLRGFEGQIKKVIRRRGIAILELNIFNRPTEARLGLELIEKPH